MRTRQEIKAIGRDRFKANYWNCVLVVLLVGVVISAIMGLAYGPQYSAAMKQVTYSAYGYGYQDYSQQPTLTFGSFVGYAALILLAGPLGVGTNFFFIMNVLGRPDLNVGTPFRETFTRFGRKLGGTLWMGLFVYLWSLLLIIPGIIKAYSYAMTPYILADCPNVKATDALKLSMRMMSGHKWELFVFHLSFIGWGILSGLTCGILGLFYVDPYMNSAQATYYLEVREAALRSGVITMAELEGSAPVLKGI